MEAVEEETWYVREVDGQLLQLWRITDRTATRMYVSNPEGGAGTYYEALPGETIWDSLRRQTPWLDGSATTGPFRRLPREPGAYHPRIARPVGLTKPFDFRLPDLEEERWFWRTAQGQLVSLVRQLQAICRVIEPTPMNLSVYGHEIRNLLILASTEVEMHWRGVLTANGRPDGRFTTNDYVKLVEPLGLRDYCVHFHPYPEMEPITPFARWNASNPTGSLEWYAAYHSVKHDREGEFDRATLGHAFSAVAACLTLMVAQFGDDALGSELASVVGIDTPDWPLEDNYLDGIYGYIEDWASIPHPDLA